MTEDESQSTWKVGELAARTGISVRTLHHYHELGLLVPSYHSKGEQRLYVKKDLERLQQILSLRDLGLSLKEIGDQLDDPERDAKQSSLEVIERHERKLVEELEKKQKLLSRLRRVARQLRERNEIELQELLQVIEEAAWIECYFDADSLAFLEEREAQLGADRIQSVQEEWKELFLKLDEERRQGMDPSSPSVCSLAKRARELVSEFSGNHSGVERSLGEMYAREGADKVLRPHGFDFEPELYGFLHRAMQALNDS